MSKDRLFLNLSAPGRWLSAARRTSIGGRLLTVILVFLAVTAATSVNASETREIELTDGSVITGEIVSLSGGVYTIKSATLGTLRIESSTVRLIRLQGSASPGDAAGQIKSLENKMLGDTEIMETIRALQNDPDFQKILQDPEIMKAVQSGDIAALTRNPDFMKLLNKQSVQDIGRKLTR
jgi:hypothetical protein